MPIRPDRGRSGNKGIIPGMSAQSRIGLVGPDYTQPCGIADYTGRLASALRPRCDLVFTPFREAMGGRLDGCQAILVQYERSLVPHRNFLERISARYPEKVFVAPHEVYAEDPFAFPYASLRSAFPPLLWGKRLRYRWAHRGYAREQALQKQGYHAFRVIPLSGPNEQLLRNVCGDRVLPVVPLAYFTPPTSSVSGPSRSELFPKGCRTVFGIFGFVNPAQDYGLALEMIARMRGEAGLLVLGGERNIRSVRRDAREPRVASDSGREVARLEAQARALGIQRSVRVTGYVAEPELSHYFKVCDAFLAPMRFKSNSSSLVNLLHAGKPILATDLPLTRWLRDQGCPLRLFADAKSLEILARGVSDRTLPDGECRYSWTFSAVADAYLASMASATSAPAPAASATAASATEPLAGSSRPEPLWPDPLARPLKINS